jgi:hypothetical protein
VGTVTWRTETLKRKTDAPNHVGSGDWLGHWLYFNPSIIKSNAEMTAPHLLAA